MSRALIKQWTEERQTLSEMIDNTLGRAESEERDLVPAEIETLEKSKTRIEEIDKQLRFAVDSIKTQESQVDLTFIEAKAQARKTQEMARTQVAEPGPSLASFVDSPQFRNFAFVGKSERATLDVRLTETRAAKLLTTTSNPIGADLMPAAQKWMAPTGVAEFPLLDVINRVPVSSNSIDAVVYGSPTGATGAAVVAEGAVKPEADFVATSQTVSIPTIAYWVEVTRQLLEDAPAARAFLDQQLRLGLLNKLETEIVTAVNGGAYTAVTGAAGQSMLEVVRQAMATAQANGFRPSAIVTDPVTAAGLDTAIFAHSLGGPVYGASAWGLRVIPVAGATKTLVGDFGRGVVLFERTGVNVMITDSGVVSGTGATAAGKDRFISNIFALLAEVRAKAVLVNAGALVEAKLATP